jgi:hypothetical protein
MVDENSKGLGSLGESPERLGKIVQFALANSFVGKLAEPEIGENSLTLRFKEEITDAQLSDAIHVIKTKVGRINQGQIFVINGNSAPVDVALRPEQAMGR